MAGMAVTGTRRATAGGEERARPNAVIMTVGIYWDAIVTLI